MSLTPNARKVLANLKSGKYNEINNRISFAVNCYDSIEEITRDEVMNAFDELEGAGMIKVYYKGHKATYPYASIDILPTGRMLEFHEKEEKKEEIKKDRKEICKGIIIGIVGTEMVNILLKIIVEVLQRISA